ncbi:MAG: NAD(P)-dependent oxidoreductase, partial [Oscillospiraceae bacterium]|nr:NAD(P)-dependent oxidoreductase [Oscillospiraceae bacterium]
MGYFPFFINIKDKKCVIIGGGNVAARKIEKLLPFEPNITVIAPEISDIIKNIKGIETVSR